MDLGLVSEPVDGHAPHPRGLEGGGNSSAKLAAVYQKATAGAAPVLTQMTAAGTEPSGAQPNPAGQVKTLATGEEEQKGGLLGLTRICHLQGDFGFVQLVPSWLCGSQQHRAKQDKLGHILRAAGDREDSAGQSWLSEHALDLGSSPSCCLFPAQHLPTGIAPSQRLSQLP